MDGLYLYADEAVDWLKSAVTKMERVYELALEKRGPMTADEKLEARRLMIDAVSNSADAQTAIQAARDEL